MLNNSLSINSLLRKECSGGKHGKTSVMKLLGLHNSKLLTILGLESKGIKLEIAWKVVVTKKTRLVYWTVGRVNPAGFGT